MAERARAVGLNHVALEVGDVDEALAFYGRIFAFELRGRAGRAWPSSTSATSSSP
jgi:predicted enzyme related to lactoylglutathione lyase